MKTFVIIIGIGFLATGAIAVATAPISCGTLGIGLAIIGGITMGAGSLIPTQGKGMYL